ncbi:hypothetical protein AAG906_003832 [Vitis piasezkii]
MDKSQELIRKKDIVCLILSYPPLNSVIKERHKIWIRAVLLITHKIKDLTVSSMKHKRNLQHLFFSINHLLDYSIHDIETYIPPGMIEEMEKETLESRTLEKERIGISGVNDTRLVSRLRSLQWMRKKFNIIILVNALHCRTVADIEDSIVGARWWNSSKFQKIVSTYKLHRVNDKRLDLEIRLKDHLLSLELFHRNVEEVHISSIGIRQHIVQVLKHCCGHLLAIVLMARALKGVKNVGIWEYSSHALQLLPMSQTEDRILFNALAFIWGRLGSAEQKCEGTKKVVLIERWIKGGLIGTLDEGDEIIRNLVNALLLESFQNDNSVRMRDEILEELIKLFITKMNPMLLELGGRGLREAPKDEAWKEVDRCELFMELPPEVGELSHLEVLDLEGTEIINLPATVGKLTNLRCLKVSFYGHDYNSRRNRQLDRVIPNNVIANLLRLEELSIDVNPDDERWNVTAKDIVKEIFSLNHLETLKFYLPKVILLNDLMSTGLSLSLVHYRFTIGSYMKRIISRLPIEVSVKFEEEERCLKYVNGEGVPTEVKELLQHTTALEPLGWNSLSNLKVLALYSCPQLTTILTIRVLKNVYNLEELLVEDCPEINSILTHEVAAEDLPLLMGCLPNLKKISLHYMPKLVTIFGGILIAPSLEWLSLYDCPNLKSLSHEEVGSNNLKVIIGEADWWSTLRWEKSECFQPSKLDSIFFPIERDTDFTTRLAEINDQLPALMQETKLSQQSATLRTATCSFKLDE